MLHCSCNLFDPIRLMKSHLFIGCDAPQALPEHPREFLIVNFFYPYIRLQPRRVSSQSTYWPCNQGPQSRCRNKNAIYQTFGPCLGAEADWLPSYSYPSIVTTHTLQHGTRRPTPTYFVAQDLSDDTRQNNDMLRWVRIIQRDRLYAAHSHSQAAAAE